MGRKRQPRPPTPPDPRLAIREQADVNRIDTFTPLGDLTFSGPNRREATLNFSEPIKDLFDQRLGLDQGLLGAASSALPGIQSLIGRPLSTQGLPGLTPLPQFENLGALDTSGLAELPQNAELFRQDVQDAFFEQGARPLRRELERREDQLLQGLSNRGFQAGSEGFREQFGDFQRGASEAFGNLSRDALLASGQEASRGLADQRALRGQGFGENLSRFESEGARLGFNNAILQQDLGNAANIRSQLFNEQGLVRSNQFNELASLLGLQQTQAPGLNSFFQPGQVDALTPFAMQQGQINENFQTRANNAAGKKGGAAGLAGTLGGGLLGGPFGAALGGSLANRFFPNA